MENREFSKPKRILSWILNVLFGLMLAMALVVIILMLSGHKFYTVKTPSMQEKYPVNSVIMVHKENPKKLKVGDVISFVADERLTIVTHRIVEVHAEAEEPYFITKGDSNESVDNKQVLFDNVLGRVKLCIPGLGRVVSLASNTVVRIVIMVLLALVIGLLVICVVKRHHSKQDSSTDC